MGSTNKTAHYELPQFVANDKPSWLGDVNQAMEAIDTGIFGAKSSADGAQTTANNAVAGVQTANTRMDGMQTQIDTIATQANQTATAVNQHTASIATNSANINTLNSRMGNTDISDIGDGTVTGAIQAISEGGGGGSNVRWNSVTDRFEVLKNGNWVQSIRAFVNNLPIWYGGVFGVPVLNGNYRSSANMTPSAYTLAGTNLSTGTMENNTERSLITDQKIDLTNYSTIKVVTNLGTVTRDISSVSGSYYVAIPTKFYVNTELYIIVTSTTGNDYQNGDVDSATTRTFTGANGLTISEITLE